MMLDMLSIAPALGCIRGFRGQDFEVCVREGASPMDLLNPNYPKP